MLGFAATDDELFVIYEYAQKGSLKNHLHDSHNKGALLVFFFLCIFSASAESCEVLATSGFIWLIHLVSQDN